MFRTTQAPLGGSDLDVDRIEAVFSRWVRVHGHPAPSAKRLAVQPRLIDDGQDDCWTHAWHVASTTPGARYVEGVCVRGRGLAQHAWVEEDTPFGPRVVECTAGYESAIGYRGLVVNHAQDGLPAHLTAEWDPPRASVIQALLGGGHTPQQVLQIVTP